VFCPFRLSLAEAEANAPECDGARPRCRACSSQASDCVYAAPSQLLAREQKLTIQALESDKSAVYEVLWYLQTKSPEQATGLLDFLRANQEGGVGAIVQHFAQYRQEFAHLTAAASNAATAPSSSSSNHYAPFAAVLPEPLDLPGLLDDRGLMHPDSVASASTRTRHATVNDLAGPLKWFFNCVGALFYIVNEDAVEESIQSIRHVDVPLGDLVSANEDPKTTTIAAELAGMASIGVVHATLSDPASAPPAELADYFYAVAKLGLDAAMEYSPLRAVKICALVAMYNIIVHATVALSYLGTNKRDSQHVNDPVLTQDKISASAWPADLASMLPNAHQPCRLPSLMTYPEPIEPSCIYSGEYTTSCREHLKTWSNRELVGSAPHWTTYQTPSALQRWQRWSISMPLPKT
jgi:hypothetical protein